MPSFRTPRTMLPRFPTIPSSSSHSFLCESSIRSSISPLNDHPDVVELRGRLNSKLGRSGGGDGGNCPLLDNVGGPETGVVGRVPQALRLGRMAV